MRYLLDTHPWLWMLTGPARLGRDTLEVVRDPNNELLLSAASSWEIAIKYSIGKLPLPETPDAYVPARMQTSGVEGLPIEHRHTLRVAALPQYHRDPFDRLLVAQAQLEGLSLITADRVFERYEVEVVRAGQPASESR
ncbi:MAG: type II toxin-antitoxin system VapC family toxin [Candidatus Dormibacteraeota bacterium]|nr:type II toxin-antitoxin system VapC family toxin [Candidatus Dormibacteraeota bacterium]